MQDGREHLDPDVALRLRWAGIRSPVNIKAVPALSGNSVHRHAPVDPSSLRLLSVGSAKLELPCWRAARLGRPNATYACLLSAKAAGSPFSSYRSLGAELLKGLAVAREPAHLAVPLLNHIAAERRGEGAAIHLGVSSALATIATFHRVTPPSAATFLCAARSSPEIRQLLLAESAESQWASLVMEARNLAGAHVSAGDSSVLGESWAQQIHGIRDMGMPPEMFDPPSVERALRAFLSMHMKAPVAALLAVVGATIDLRALRGSLVSPQHVVLFDEAFLASISASARLENPPRSEDKTELGGDPSSLGV